MIKVKCYGGPAHGREVNLDALTARQVTLRVERRPAHYLLCPPFNLRVPPLPRITTNTYYLQTYEQTGFTPRGAEVYRQLQVALLEGADLLVRELHDLRYAMDDLPWIWSQDPSILGQFDKWIEKTLHDLDWERVIVHY